MLAYLFLAKPTTEWCGFSLAQRKPEVKVNIPQIGQAFTGEGRTTEWETRQGPGWVKLEKVPQRRTEQQGWCKCREQRRNRMKSKHNVSTTTKNKKKKNIPKGFKIFGLRSLWTSFGHSQKVRETLLSELWKQDPSLAIKKLATVTFCFCSTGGHFLLSSAEQQSTLLWFCLRVTFLVFLLYFLMDSLPPVHSRVVKYYKNEPSEGQGAFQTWALNMLL